MFLDDVRLRKYMFIFPLHDILTRSSFETRVNVLLQRRTLLEGTTIETRKKIVIVSVVIVV